MSGSTSKKVVVRRFDREALAGYVNPQTCLQPDGLELLSVSGAVSVVPYSEVKTVFFVKDFDLAGPPADALVFRTRPKVNGLWLRGRLRDGDVIEGVLANNLLQVEAAGFTLTPPRPTSNNQRMFVPRAALTEVHVLGVVGSPLHERKPKAKEQIELFE